MSTNDKNNSGPAITYITESSKIDGDIDCKNDIRIAGTIEGKVTSAKKVIVAESGLIKGTLTSPSADISGKITGDVKASESLILRSSANIDGEITTEKIKIEEGAKVKGNFQVGSQKNSSKTEDKKSSSSKFSLKKEKSG